MPFPLSRRAACLAMTVALATLSITACSATTTATGPSSSSSSAPSTSTAPLSSSEPASEPATTARAATSAPPKTTIVTASDPCKVVTKADAEKVVGTPLQAPTTAGGSDDRLCQYTSDPTGPEAQVAVIMGAGAKKALDLDKDTLQHAFTPLKGVGDEAYLESGNVFVRKGTVWVAVNVVALDAPEDQVQTALTKLASTIAGRL